jgi:hypothetical protein
VDSAWEQEKLEARKILENGDETHSSVHALLGAPLFFNAKHLKTRIGVHPFLEGETSLDAIFFASINRIARFSGSLA